LSQMPRGRRPHHHVDALGVGKRLKAGHANVS
jgi:hypothetical protein